LELRRNLLRYARTFPPGHVSGIVPNVIPPPFLIFEQHAKGSGQLPVLTALAPDRQ
jgi:hypothetical protein